MSAQSLRHYSLQAARRGSPAKYSILSRAPTSGCAGVSKINRALSCAAAALYFYAGFMVFFKAKFFNGFALHLV
jgi:hypothetical protein